MNLTFTVFAQAAVFIAFVLFTKRFVWPHLLKAIETRQKTIADGLAAAEQGKRSLETSTKQAEDAIKEAFAQIPGDPEKEGLASAEVARLSLSRGGVVGVTQYHVLLVSSAGSYQD